MYTRIMTLNLVSKLIVGTSRVRVNNALAGDPVVFLHSREKESNGRKKKRAQWNAVESGNLGRSMNLQLCPPSPDSLIV